MVINDEELALIFAQRFRLSREVAVMETDGPEKTAKLEELAAITERLAHLANGS